jgi:hypothetical protein
MAATYVIHASLLDRDIMKGQPPMQSVRKAKPVIIREILVPSRFPEIEGRLNNSVIEVMGDFSAEIGFGNGSRVLNEA